MSKGEKIFLTIALGVAFVIGLVICSPAVRAAWNEHFWTVQKIDDATNYNTRKQVEDTCRAMVASYESDKLIWEQYKDSDNEEKLSWAEQAKMRANKTASTYNNYILENSYVWEDNIPADIDRELPYITDENRFGGDGR